MGISQPGKRNATHETPIGKLLETRLQELTQNRGVKPPLVPAKQLERHLGVGDMPLVRRSVYRKLERLQKEHGFRVFKIVWQTLKRSQSKSDPGRWFVTVAIDELERLELWGEDTY